MISHRGGVSSVSLERFYVYTSTVRGLIFRNSLKGNVYPFTGFRDFQEILERVRLRSGEDGMESEKRGSKRFVRKKVDNL